jgi:aminotransferase
MSDVEFSNRLYDEHHVATVPGSAFGTAGKGRVRVSYAAEENTLREGMRRLASAIKAWDRTAAKV